MTSALFVLAMLSFLLLLVWLVSSDRRGYSEEGFFSFKVFNDDGAGSERVEGEAKPRWRRNS